MKFAGSWLLATSMNKATLECSFHKLFTLHRCTIIIINGNQWHQFDVFLGHDFCSICLMCLDTTDSIWRCCASVIPSSAHKNQALNTEKVEGLGGRGLFQILKLNSEYKVAINRQTTFQPPQDIVSLKGLSIPCFTLNLLIMPKCSSILLLALALN